MAEIIALILRGAGEAISLGLDPVQHIKEQLALDPRVDTRLLDQVLAKMEAAGAGENDNG